MGNVRKSFSLFLVFVLATTIVIIVKPAFALTPSPPSIPAISVPEFTVKLAAQPFYQSPTTTTNPYTGQSEVTQAGYYDENLSLIIIIKNQPFTYSLGNTTYNLYYNVQIKPHFGQNDWTQLYGQDVDYPTQSNSEYTVLIQGINTGSSDDGEYPLYYPNSAQMDVQVEAFVGYPYLMAVSVHALYPQFGPFNYYPAVTDNETSGWSNTQTVITPANNDTALSPPALPSSSINPTSTPSSSTSTLTQPATATPTLTSVSSPSKASLLVIVIIVLLVIVALLVAIIILMGKRKPGNSSQQTVSKGGA